MTAADTMAKQCSCGPPRSFCVALLPHARLFAWIKLWIFSLCYFSLLIAMTDLRKNSGVFGACGWLLFKNCYKYYSHSVLLASQVVMAAHTWLLHAHKLARRAHVSLIDTWKSLPCFEKYMSHYQALFTLTLCPKCRWWWRWQCRSDTWYNNVLARQWVLFASLIF